MSRNSFYSRVGGFVIAISLVAPAVSSAQGDALDEIVVTAQKREQNLQDVPISITALSGDMVDDLGFRGTLDVFSQVPNVDVTDFSYSGGINIRGNSTLNTTLAGEGNVALYFDGIYRPIAYYSGNQLLDVERIEVLRGPQGTLFGRNSASGLVHFISRKPTEEFQGYANVEVGSYDTRIFQAAAGGPFSDSVRGRLAVRYHEDDGFQDNLGPAGGKFGVTDHWAARGHLDMDFSDSFNLLLTLEAAEQDDIGRAFHYWGLLDQTTFEQCEPARVHSGQCGGGGPAFGLPAFQDPVLDPEQIYTEFDPNAGDNRYTLETMTAIATATWQVSDNVEFVSVTAYDTHDRFFNPDEDASVDGVLGGFFSFDDHYTSDTDQFTQEFRLSGDRGRTHWVAGLYYFDEKRDSTSTVIDFESFQSPDTIVELNSESWAVFGEVEFGLSETVSLLVGGRYTEDEKDVSVLTAAVPGSQALSSEDFDWKVSLQWRPRDALLIYGAVATGTRSGNFNTDLLFGDISALTSVSPETVTSYDVGLKTTFWNDRGRFNASLFHTDAKDKQGLTYDTLSAAPVTRLISIGDAEIRGAELELFLLPTENFEISLGVALLDTEISAEPGFSYTANWGAGANAGIGDRFFLDGSELSVPDISVNGVIRYNFEFGSAGNAAVQLDFEYEDEVTGANEITINEEHTLVNFRAFWSSPSERYEVEAYVKNVFDETYIVSMFALSGVDYAYGNMSMPQWYGVKFGMNF